MLTKENCELALEEYNFRSERPLPHEYSLLRRLIEEHFDNPPLKWEELKPNMWVWDNKCDSYYKISDLDEFKGIMFEGGFYYEWFEENRYFRKQVDE